LNNKEVSFKKTQLLSIEKIAAKISLKSSDLEFYGPYKAKITKTFPKPKDNNLILVTATTPGKYGEGKTTTAIGLSQALWKLKAPNIVVLREPSLGPCFGIKGGATGGGRATVEPADDINYHFTGDIHAITYAHNLLSSLIDNSLYFGNPLNIDPKTIFWPRVIDLNDRALKEITLKMTRKKSPDIKRNTCFDISVASEIMAILCLAKNLADLKKRLAKIIIGFDNKGKPITAKMLKANGAMAVLLKDALKPNLVQTSSNTPAIVHGGPFANIAHGTPSITAIKTAQNLAPYTVVEAGFGADLGAEKFLDIVCRLGDLKPKATVLVITARAVSDNGLKNISRHIKNLQNFGLRPVIALNRFDNDDKNIIAKIKNLAKKQNIPLADSFVFQKGEDGGRKLAKKVIKTCQDNPKPKISYTYSLNDPIKIKILKLCQKIYGAKTVSYAPKAKKQLAKLAKIAKNNFVCMAKTQYSISDNPEQKGAPSNYTFKIKEIRVAAGANFIIPVAGQIMTMPGLPRHPRAETIKLP